MNDKGQKKGEKANPELQYTVQIDTLRYINIDMSIHQYVKLNINFRLFVYTKCAKCARGYVRRFKFNINFKKKRKK